MLVHGVEWNVLDFKRTPRIAENLDPSGAQSRIPPKVLIINDIRTHLKCVIQEIGMSCLTTTIVFLLLGLS